nr:hypothetical protein [Tanacetum cinerariifolium]
DSFVIQTWKLLFANTLASFAILDGVDLLTGSRGNNLYTLSLQVDELRAISGHMLGASRVQIPENNLDNLHSIIEDGTLEIMDPQELLGFLRDTIAVVVILVKGHTFLTNVKVHPVGCDLLALESKFTPVEESTGVLETTFVEDVVLTGVFPDEGLCSINLIFLLLFFGVTAISLVTKSLMQGHVCLRMMSNS